jgi:hypothetical protein
MQPVQGKSASHLLRIPIEDPGKVHVCGGLQLALLLTSAQCTSYRPGRANHIK